MKYTSASLVCKICENSGILSFGRVLSVSQQSLFPVNFRILKIGLALPSNEMPDFWNMHRFEMRMGAKL